MVDVGIETAAQRVSFTTPCDEMGVYRVYPDLPSFEPDNNITLDEINNAVALVDSPFGDIEASPTSFTDSAKFYEPYSNPTTFLLMKWMQNDSNLKSIAQIDLLVRDVILSPHFDRASLRNFSAATESRKLDTFLNSPPESLSARLQEMGRWKEETVEISLPHTGVELDSEAVAPKYRVQGLLRRSIVDIATSALQSPDANSFHYTPFRHM